jgi:ABC-type thiamine transport system ATPase subunit
METQYPLTLQKAFNKAYVGCIVKQKGIRCYNKQKRNCVYDDGKGNHCAIGQCLPKNSPCMKSTGTFSGLYDQYREHIVQLFGQLTLAQRYEYDELQRAHDSGQTPESMKAKFEHFAKRYNLTIPQVSH